MGLRFLLGGGGSCAGHESVEGGRARGHGCSRVRVWIEGGFEEGEGFGREGRGNERREYSSWRECEGEGETRREKGVGYTAEHQLKAILCMC